MNRDELSQKIEEHENDRAFSKARDAMRALGDALNGGNKDAAMVGALVGLLTTHRYLANEAVIVLLTALGEFGGMEEASVSDARNSFAYRISGKIRTALKDELFWKDA